jgi:hypothetical protein
VSEELLPSLSGSLASALKMDVVGFVKTLPIDRSTQCYFRRQE